VPIPAVIHTPPVALTIQTDGFRLSYDGRKQGMLDLGPIGATVGSGFNDLVANSVAD
jgi:hypothetical protein